MLGTLLAPACGAGAAVLAPAVTAAPWTQPGYSPQPGHWRPYVLAPAARIIRPAAVLPPVAQAGSVSGNPDAILTTDGKGVTLTSTSTRSGSPLLTVDFGQEMAGYIRLRLLPGSGGVVPPIHVCYSESKQFMAAPSSQQGAMAPGCDLANIFNGYVVGPYVWDSDSHLLWPGGPVTSPITVTDHQSLRGGFRYATIFLDGPGSATIDSVENRFSAAPNQRDLRAYRGWFLSSDNLLNKIWYAGAYTIQIDTVRADTAKEWPYAPGQPDMARSQILFIAPRQEVLFDGGKRDRQVWQGDLSIQSPVTYLTTGDRQAVDNSLVTLVRQQLPNGYVPACSMESPWNSLCVLFGEYVEWFVNNIAEHYRWTGDRAFLDRWYAATKNAMSWLESQRDSTGLVDFTTANDTYAYGGSGHMTYWNALYVMNLRQMATLADAEGDTALAAQDRGEADALATLINAQLWDPKAGAYRFSVETPDDYPQDANAAAIVSAVATPQQAASALAYLKAHNWSTYGSLDNAKGGSGPVPATYQEIPSYYEVLARLQNGDAAGALTLMRTFWGHQLAADGPRSTWWENVAQDGTPGLGSFTSLAHGWGSGPTIALTTQVLGVEPLSDGFRTYTVRPHPGGLNWAQGAVPTPRGPLRLSWVSAHDSFTEWLVSPPGTRGTLAVPVSGANPRVTINGSPAWSDGRPQRVRGAGGAYRDGDYVVFTGVPRGRWTLRALAG